MGMSRPLLRQIQAIALGQALRPLDSQDSRSQRSADAPRRARGCACLQGSAQCCFRVECRAGEAFAAIA